MTQNVMAQFDNDDFFQINTIKENGKFIIELKDGSIEFRNNDKTFKIFIDK